MITLPEIQKMTAKDIGIELAKARYQFGKLQFLVKTGQEKGAHKMKAAKKLVAQLLTVLAEKN